MLKSAFAAGFALFVFNTSAPPVLADPLRCARTICPNVFHLTSVSATKSYGLLLGAPEDGCRRVRYRVETGARDFLGHTPPLAPGEVAVVSMGQGFAEGTHALTIAAVGCDQAPALARRVTLKKLSPDHGWRPAQ
jgi:hypothetical protein